MQEIFFNAIREEYPNEEVTRLVFADWCADNAPELEEKLRKHIPIVDGLIIHPYFGDGNRYKYSSEIRHGCGGLFGYGHYLYGYGNGYSDGKNNGYGNGYRDRYNNLALNMPKLHTNQLVFLPFGFVFCGYVAEQMGPYVFKLKNAKMIFDNCGICWKDLANGKGRSNYLVISTMNFGTITIGPQMLHSLDWAGDLP